MNSSRRRPTDTIPASVEWTVNVEPTRRMSRDRDRRVLTRRTALKAIGLGTLGTGLWATSAGARDARDDPGGWPQFGHDAANTGQNPQAEGISREAEEQWRVTDDWDFWHIALVDGTVYASAGMGAFPFHLEGKVYAINAAHGTRKWSFTPNGRPEGTPAVSDGTVFFGANDETVYALNAAEGTEKWRFRTSGNPSRITVVDDTIYVGTSYRTENTTLYALDVNGSKRWEFDAGGSANVAPAVSDGTIIVHSATGTAKGSDSDTLHALAASDGAEKWSTQMAAGGSTPPVVSWNTVFLGDSDGNVYALEKDTGATVWQFDAGSEINATPAVANQTVYVGSSGPPDGTVFALDATTGEKRWEFPLDGDTGGIALDADTLYVSSHDGHVYGVDANSGDQRWRFQVEGFAQPPIVVDDRVYLGSGNGNLYALTEAEGVR